MTNDRSAEDILEIRRKLVQIEFLAKSDGQFLERLREDPIAVLREQGFDDLTNEEVLGQLRSDPALGFGKCDPFTCLVTGCSFFTAQLAEFFPDGQ